MKPGDGAYRSILLTPNASGLEYEQDGSGIRVSLVVVNGVGPAMARRIVADRQRKGLFRSRKDFLTRLSLPDRIVEVLQQPELWMDWTSMTGA